jgi:hypothetical protein
MSIAVAAVNIKATPAPAVTRAAAIAGAISAVPRRSSFWLFQTAAPRIVIRRRLFASASPFHGKAGNVAKPVACRPKRRTGVGQREWASGCSTLKTRRPQL